MDNTPNNLRAVDLMFRFFGDAQTSFQIATQAFRETMDDSLDAFESMEHQLLDFLVGEHSGDWNAADDAAKSRSQRLADSDQQIADVKSLFEESAAAMRKAVEPLPYVLAGFSESEVAAVVLELEVIRNSFDEFPAKTQAAIEWLNIGSAGVVAAINSIEISLSEIPKFKDDMLKSRYCLYPAIRSIRQANKHFSEASDSLQNSENAIGALRKKIKNILDSR